MSHYYSPNPDIKSQEFSIQAEIRGRGWNFTSDRGVFSKDGIDFGSRLLIETVQLPSGADILDLGCGYGVIGIVLSSLLDSGRVSFADINQRSLSLARKNASKYGLQSARFYLGDGFLAEKIGQDGAEEIKTRLGASGAGGEKFIAKLGDETFSDIFLNPPIRTGKAKIYELFADAKMSLRPGGSLWIVINKKHGADSAQAYLKTIYPRVEIVAKKSGYQIIRCQMDLSASELPAD